MVNVCIKVVQRRKAAVVGFFSREKTSVVNVKKTNCYSSRLLLLYEKET